MIQSNKTTNSNFPKVVELKPQDHRVKVNINDPAFHRPLSELNKSYSGTVVLITKIKPRK